MFVSRYMRSLPPPSRNACLLYFRYTCSVKPVGSEELLLLKICSFQLSKTGSSFVTLALHEGLKSPAPVPKPMSLYSADVPSSETLHLRSWVTPHTSG